MIYTPTEGDAIQNYSRLFRRPEGCFLNITDQDRIEESLANFGRGEDVDYIVVSDGEEVGYGPWTFLTGLTNCLSLVDSWNRRSRSRGYTDFHRQAGDYHLVCWDSSITTVAGGAGLWD